VCECVREVPPSVAAAGPGASLLPLLRSGARRARVPQLVAPPASRERVCVCVCVFWTVRENG
jgi:hypothetical protein